MTSGPSVPIVLFIVVYSILMPGLSLEMMTLESSKGLMELVRGIIEITDFLLHQNLYARK